MKYWRNWWQRYNPKLALNQKLSLTLCAGLRFPKVKTLIGRFGCFRGVRRKTPKHVIKPNLFTRASIWGERQRRHTLSFQKCDFWSLFRDFGCLIDRFGCFSGYFGCFRVSRKTPNRYILGKNLCPCSWTYKRTKYCNVEWRVLKIILVLNKQLSSFSGALIQGQWYARYGQAQFHHPHVLDIFQNLLEDSIITN